ncbi:phosphonopyruvate decarboxylase [Streptomyces sp. NPDC018610]|uniref:phosphonopyruvate decarboxylase n=1 Tax=Streptomyces sp. NPDC018610 TaxID=3365049 RepID=UPI0037A93C54
MTVRQGSDGTTVASPAPLDPSEAVRLLRAEGYGPFTGVPCSYLGPVISCLQEEFPGEYLIAANEGEAVAIAAGAQLAGRRPVVLLQNSGLGNAVNPLTSLCHTLRVPVLLLVTWRGEPGRPDEPQHEVMGRITPSLLTSMEIRNEVLSGDRLAQRLRAAGRHMEETGLPFAFVVPKGTFARRAAAPGPRPGGTMLRRDAVAEVVRAVGDSSLIVATTGKTARELEADWDRPENLYVVGSMGCASSVALGVALQARSRQVVVLDGDGAALMRLEAMAAIGRLAPTNLLHVLIDNEAYESTGGQPTGSGQVNFTEIAAACGYRAAREVSSAEGLRSALERQLSYAGPALLRVRVAPGSDPGLGRPALAPPASAERFRKAARV